MRDIKFRVFNKTINEIVDWDYIILCKSRFHLYYNDENYIFMQYTGLKDKNGKEIYEGDIIGKEGAYVIYNNILGCWCFAFKGDKDSTPIFYLNMSELEVIGNIYENADLLNKQK